MHSGVVWRNVSFHQGSSPPLRQVYGAWPYLLSNLQSSEASFYHPVVRVIGASCCGIVWRYGVRSHDP
jgi:hypothetical protein